MRIVFWPWVPSSSTLMEPLKPGRVPSSASEVMGEAIISPFLFQKHEVFFLIPSLSRLWPMASWKKVPQLPLAITMGYSPAGASSMIVNDGAVNGAGRTVWMSVGDDNRDDRWVLLRAAIAWAAGEDYNMIPGTISNPSTFSAVKVIEENNPLPGTGMYQPIEVVLSLGYIF